MSLFPFEPCAKYTIADEIVGDVLDILMALGDFDEFKAMMLAHRAGRKRGLMEIENVGPNGSRPEEQQCPWGTNEACVEDGPGTCLCEETRDSFKG